MQLNPDSYPCPIDLDDSINEYDADLAEDQAKINAPYVSSSIISRENINIVLKEPIYVMTVELGDGNSEGIRIFPDSKPEELSFNFCKSRNLDLDSMNYLNQQITALLDQYKKTNSDEAMLSIQEVEEDDFSSNRIKPGKMNWDPSVLESEIKAAAARYGRNEDINLEKNRQNANLICVNNKVNSQDNSGKLNKNKSSVKSDFIDNELKLKKDGNITVNKNKIRDSKNENKFNTWIVKSNMNRLSKEKNSKICFVDQEKKNNNHSNDNNKNTLNQNRNLFSYEIFQQCCKTPQFNPNNAHNEEDSTPLPPNHKVDINKHRRYTSSNKTENSLRIVSEEIPLHIFNRHKNSNKKSRSTNIESLSSQPLKPPQSRGANSHNIAENGSIDHSNSTIDLDQMIYQISAEDDYYPPNKPKSGLRAVINTGERLYQKNTKLQQETRRKLDVYKKTKDEEYNSQYTYKPRINSKSAEIIKRRYENKIINMIQNTTENQKNSLQDMLYDTNYFSAAWLENVSHYDVYLDEKLEKLRKKHEKIEEYRFAPEINKNSKKIAEDKFKSKLILQLEKRNSESTKLDSFLIQNTRVNDLYEKWRLRALKVNKLAENVYSECTFKPQVNNRSQGEYVSMPFEQRQEVFKKRVEDKIHRIEMISYPMNYLSEKIRSHSSENHAVKTENFIQVNPPASNIFNHLYQHAKKYSHDRYIRAKTIEDQLIKNMHAVHTLVPSEQIINKKKKFSFQKIFRILDADEDNIISSFYLDTSKLDKDILRIIQPILRELKEEQETLNEDEFVRACMHLYEVNYLFIK